ncbi:hypothetical protein FF1_035941 [Malus domestica]
MRNVGRIEENILVILNSSKRGRPGYSGYCIWFQTPIHVLLIVEGKTDGKAELSPKHARRLFNHSVSWDAWVPILLVLSDSAQLVILDTYKRSFVVDFAKYKHLNRTIRSPFLEIACILIAGLTIIMWLIVVVSGIVLTIFMNILIELYASVVVYQVRSGTVALVDLMAGKKENGYPPTKHKSTTNLEELGRSKSKCKGPRLNFSQPYPTHKVKQKYAKLMPIPKPKDNYPRLIPPSIDDEDTWDFTKSRNETAEVEIEELVVHLERNMDLSTMEQGVKLVGKVLANKTLVTVYMGCWTILERYRGLRGHAKESILPATEEYTSYNSNVMMCGML